ncbi:DNA topoisomerase IB [Notoacmeibacter ruber]|uniref:DNA topoisomerase IB n=1 Tax=Notoacmeibacter ruber TaxID=2670375 RepID=UPI0011C48F5C|nr:DNA topoisomerase IB [Notoacmeibacter ruber]
MLESGPDHISFEPLPDPEAEDYYEQLADRACLVYVTDEETGWSRRRAGKGYTYRDKKGHRIDDASIRERLNALAIPPAWTDVWLCPDPRGHIQATGRDAKGRKQYRYHPEWMEQQSRLKFETLPMFGTTLPTLRQRVDQDLRRHGMPKDKAIALVVWLLDNTMIRIGNVRYAKKNRSFGLTTLKKRHLDLGHSRIRFTFTGKSGKDWDLSLTDRRIARVIRSISELPGQHLFKYQGDDSKRHPVRSHDVNDYIRETLEEDFSAKDFRTWTATVLAADALQGIDLPETKRQQAMVLNSAIDEVASVLGNTRTVCRSQYIHPTVIDAWHENQLCEQLAAIDAQDEEWLDGGEVRLLNWFAQQADCTVKAKAA